MATIISPNLEKTNVPTGYQAGVVVNAIFTHTFTGAVATTDILELGVLPAHAQILEATLIGDTMGAITCDIGLMSGTAGAKDDSRTVGDELFDAADINNATTAAALTTMLAIGRSPSDRGLGFVPSTNVTAGAKSVTLSISYRY